MPGCLTAPRARAFAPLGPPSERVFIFDHTLRETGNSNLNAADGGSAAPVPRVHCDYTASGAPRRLQQLAEEGIYSRIRLRVLMPDEAAALAAGRFAFINVWRSIDATHPVMQQPLAVCDEDSVPEADRFTCEQCPPRCTIHPWHLPLPFLLTSRSPRHIASHALR